MAAIAEKKPSGSIGLPGVVEWSLTNARTGERRVFTQTELTIEGEARLLGLVRQVAAALNEQGFPWEKLGPLFEPDTPVDWLAATDVLGGVAAAAPAAIAECCTILLSIYPTNEDGSRNPDFDADLRFIRGAVKFATWIDMLKVFAEQNDYQRLADPIGAILGRAVSAGMATKTTTSTPAISTGDETNDAS